ncbi:MAG: M42 family metallopeptidase [Endomicrobiaceae bacterium]|jgi:endoglucanase|nr:M42 family metallopeptidase [Endomicrobiaceae bacterium]
MDNLLKELLLAPGISGCEEAVAQIMKRELEKTCDEVRIDNFGNVIAKKGNGPKKIMIAAHMDEIGLAVKYVNNEGFIYFIKVGGIADMVLPGQRVIIKAKKGDVCGVIGTKPPHLQGPDERKKVMTHDNMFIDIGCGSKQEVLEKVEIGDQIIFEPNAGVLNKDVYYGKAIDNRAGCYAMIKVMEQLASPDAEVYAVATAQEEVGLKGARTSSFAINPDFALILDTTVAGDVPGIEDKMSSLRLGEGIAITLIEASGRGTIVSNKVRRLMIDTAKENNIKHQIDVIDGGMTDGAVIYMNREGILTGILSIPTRYLHASSSVFNIKDLESAVELSVKVISKIK